MGRCAGLRTGVGGNIGLPALELLKDDYELCVLELSSFQLETTFSLKPAAATVLNVTEDHMDRYPQGLEQYRAAKLRVYHDAAVCVYNAEDALTQPAVIVTAQNMSASVLKPGITGWIPMSRHSASAVKKLLTAVR